jgi:fatty acid desaturase
MQPENQPEMNEQDRVTSQAVDADRRQTESIKSLLRRLADNTTTLFSKEIAVARSEFTHAIDEAKRGAASLATGGAVLLAGFLFLLGAGAIALANVMPPWLAYLLVGAVVAVIGLIMVGAGRKKMQPSSAKMARTRESLQRDKALAEGKPQ